MPRKKTRSSKTLTLKQQLRTVNRELARVQKLQWTYSKRLLKFGIATWIFGLSTFLSSIIIMDAKALSATYNLWVPIMIATHAVPLLITAVMIRKFSSKIRYLERLRHALLSEYEKVMLKKVEKMITER
ncbi:MAG TPA: hypothetical protein ENF64_01715 [Hadesarchaea archaeon]|nr:hypothetical protein [Hadesarchaea archaeon]